MIYEDYYKIGGKLTIVAYGVIVMILLLVFLMARQGQFYEIPSVAFSIFLILFGLHRWEMVEHRELVERSERFRQW